MILVDKPLCSMYSELFEDKPNKVERVQTLLYFKTFGLIPTLKSRGDAMEF